MSVEDRWKNRGLPVEQRFWMKVDRTDTCWLWTASKTRNGYGMFGVSIDGKVTTSPAHRWAYEMLVGPIPTGLQIDHLCRVRHCVNPAHLEPVTGTQNIRRGWVARRRERGLPATWRDGEWSA